MFTLLIQLVNHFITTATHFHMYLISHWDHIAKLNPTKLNPNEIKHSAKSSTSKVSFKWKTYLCVKDEVRSSSPHCLRNNILDILKIPATPNRYYHYWLVTSEADPLRTNCIYLLAFIAYLPQYWKNIPASFYQVLV